MRFNSYELFVIWEVTSTDRAAGGCAWGGGWQAGDGVGRWYGGNMLSAKYEAESSGLSVGAGSGINLSDKKGGEGKFVRGFGSRCEGKIVYN
jgi:hypothetical protein